MVAPPGGRWTTPADFVGDALTELERVAAELLPAWLPDARIDRPDLGGVAAIRLAASAHARRAHYTPALLMDLAVLAVTGQRDTRPQLPFAARAAQLGRLVAEGFRRFQAALLVPLAADLTAAEQDAIVAGAGWLAHNGKVAVWLVGATPLSGDQIPLIHLAGPPPRPPAPIGRPHPASGVEAALEAALATVRWAAGRRWNQPYQSSPLSTPIRLDLLCGRPARPGFGAQRLQVVRRTVRPDRRAGSGFRTGAGADPVQGYFFLVGLLDAGDFWSSVLAAMLDGLSRPVPGSSQTQLVMLLRRRSARPARPAGR